jgi:hypothetical protein
MAIEISKQTATQFHEYFKDILNSLVRKTFKDEKELLFITYQPDELELSNEVVAAQTLEIFGKIRYVQVLEQTFFYSKVYNSADYTNGFHSHLIVAASDYEKIETQLDGLDIVAKWVYNIDGLIFKYLPKQAGATYHRLLPTVHIPTPQPTVETEPIVHEPEIIVFTVAKQKFVLQTKSFIANVFIRINKIISYLRFIDDT